jgi:hypothetical protein
VFHCHADDTFSNRVQQPLERASVKTTGARKACGFGFVRHRFALLNIYNLNRQFRVDFRHASSWRTNGEPTRFHRGRSAESFQSFLILLDAGDHKASNRTDFDFGTKWCEVVRVLSLICLESQQQKNG